jgi:predicted Zn-dependent protease
MFLRYYVFRTALPVLLLASMGMMASAQASPAAAVPLAPAQPLAQKQEAISDQVSAAEGAIANTDWKTAEAKLDAWLAAHPGDPRALFDAGYVADVQNRTEDAIHLYQRAIKADPNSFDPRLLLGILLARQGKLDEARPELERATQLDAGEGSSELKARAWRALARIDSGSDPAAASNDLLQALKLSPETTADTLLAASLAEESGDFDAAEAAYRRVLTKDSASEPANAGLAHLLIKKKQYPEAETLLRAALKKAPDDPALTAQLAAVLAVENKAGALPLLEKLHSQHPGDSAITRMLAEVEADAGDFAASDALYVTLLAAKPQDPDLLIGHGQNLVREQKYADAYQVFDKATQLDPASADAWSGLAFSASRTGRPDVTLHALTMRSRLLPENPSTYFLWATAYDSLHQRTQAAAYYHHFLDSAQGRFPNEEWQARQRLKILGK